MGWVCGALRLGIVGRGAAAERFTEEEVRHQPVSQCRAEEIKRNQEAGGFELLRAPFGMNKNSMRNVCCYPGVVGGDMVGYEVLCVGRWLLQQRWICCEWCTRKLWWALLRPVATWHGMWVMKLYTAATWMEHEFWWNPGVSGIRIFELSKQHCMLYFNRHNWYWYNEFILFLVSLCHPSRGSF